MKKAKKFIIQSCLILKCFEFLFYIRFPSIKKVWQLDGNSIWMVKKDNSMSIISEIQAKSTCHNVIVSIIMNICSLKVHIQYIWVQLTTFYHILLNILPHLPIFSHILSGTKLSVLSIFYRFITHFVFK